MFIKKTLIWMVFALSIASGISTISYAVQVNKVILIDTDASSPISGFNPISNGTTIDLAKLPSRNLSLRVDTDLSTRSVIFKLDGTNSYLANMRPFSLCGIDSTTGGFLPCSLLKVGSHVVEVTPYSKTGGTGKIGSIFKRSFVITDSTTTTGSCVRSRGMWLWTTRTILNDPHQQDLLVSMSQQANVTDIFEYLVPRDFVQYESALRAFNAKLNKAGIHAWGLDGYRGYFHDADGPAPLYADVDALIAFNSRVALDEAFVGFHTDLEPQDGQKGTNLPASFHNGIPDSGLSKTDGGVVYPSEAEDREMLMRDWLDIQSAVGEKLHAAGLKLGGAMPSWTSNYYGEEVKVTYNGIRQGVMKFMMGILDDYVVMSYNTNPTNAANRVLAQVTYADTLPLKYRPRVYGSVETNEGVGSNVSYGDTAGKQSKTAVFTDIKTIESILGTHPSFCGISIHDWDGWLYLPE